MKLFIFKGDPIQLVRTDRENDFLGQKIAVQACQITLNNQYEDPPLRGMIGIEYIFYLPLPKRGYKVHRDEGSFQSGRPFLSSLLKFFDRVCKGVVWTDPSQISCISARKIYGIDPRTEIIITEMDNE